MMEAGSSGQAPVRSLTLTVDKSQREELFAQLRKFANKHAFEFTLTFYDRNKKFFLVAMYREDLKILAVDVPESPTKVRISFYAKYPGYPVNEETVGELFSDLKRFISEIPNVTITEEK